LKSIRPFIDIIVEFLTESTPPENLPQTDAIFVFGHYEPLVAHHAAELWKKGKAPRIIISGKGRDVIPKGFETEADFYASLIESDGVSLEALILEKEATNSLENVLLGIAACHSIGFNPKSLILCAMPPLLKRSCATFRKQFPDIIVYGSAFPMPEEWFTFRHIGRLLENLKDSRNTPRRATCYQLRFRQKWPLQQKKSDNPRSSDLAITGAFSF